MRKKATLTFADAIKRKGPRAVGAMVKPVGATCNLDCTYCYYLDKARLAPKAHAAEVMSDELLERFVKQYIEANQVPVVSFCWHGGEPLLAGREFYRKAVEFQKMYRGEKRIENSIQTNGTLLTDEWARFFAEEEFLVGVSIDGPREVHDANRRDRAGESTFDRVMGGIERLKEQGAEFNTLSAVGAASEGRGREIYRFLKGIGSRFMQFLPVVEHVKRIEGWPREVIVEPGNPEAHRAEWSVGADAYGRFLNDVFDEWVTGDVGSYFVQMFDATLAGWCGVRPGLCAFCETCGDALAVEHNGDVYACDHFVYPEYRRGNIATGELRTMAGSGEQFRFGLEKRNALPTECLRCGYLHLCRGECPKHRFVPSERNPEERVNALCGGLRAFYRHSEPYMLKMRELLEAGEPAALVIPWARQRMGLF
ncbi:anaerobic sulfatase maturase [uncultured Rikenella sp.]|uniref:anaerobic sulfatase maturase n=1 Tax=uncultured Rikenella sp. TaxID=368003 RepID=UPI00272D91BB|nr:anaerobic sulfatase maturase [uncultured Rikenella sp.]